MLNRRHIRVKVLQTIYAMHQSGSDQLEKEEKFLFASIESIQDLYLIVVSALVEIRKKEEDFLEKASKKHLATEKDLKPNKKFISNRILLALEETMAKHLENILVFFIIKKNLSLLSNQLFGWPLNLIQFVWVGMRFAIGSVPMAYLKIKKPTKWFGCSIHILIM